MLAQLAAAELFDCSRWPHDQPHVIVPRRQRPIDGIVSYKCLRLDPRDVTTRRGIPVATVARLLLDLSAGMTKHQVTSVINEAAFRRRFDERATLRLIERANGHWGIGVLKQALALFHQGSAGTRSRYEDAFLALVGLPATRSRT